MDVVLWGAVMYAVGTFTGARLLFGKWPWK